MTQGLSSPMSLTKGKSQLAISEHSTLEKDGGMGDKRRDEIRVLYLSLGFLAASFLTCIAYLLGLQEGIATNLVFILLASLVTALAGVKGIGVSIDTVLVATLILIFTCLGLSMYGEVNADRYYQYWRILTSPARTIGLEYPFGDAWFPVSVTLWSLTVAGLVAVAVIAGNLLGLVMRKLIERWPAIPKI